MVFPASIKKKKKIFRLHPQAGKGLLHPVVLETPPWRNCRPKSACLLTVLLLLMVCADPYVKVSLMCDGRRLKKRKTSTKRNTLNPVYNEAIVFDVPPENIDQIHLSIAVMDYDRWDAWSCFSLQTHCAQVWGKGWQPRVLSCCPSAATKQHPESWLTRNHHFASLWALLFLISLPSSVLLSAPRFPSPSLYTP